MSGPCSFPVGPLPLNVDALAAASGVTITPEAVVFDRTGTRINSGRIDDRYADFGILRSTPARRELREVPGAPVEGGAVAPRETQVVGSLIE